MQQQLANASAKTGTSGALTWAALPLDPVTMVVGLISALVALLHIRPREGDEARTPLRVFALVAGSAFLAGVFAPLAVAGGLHYQPWLSTVESEALRVAAAAMIGAAPHVIPMLWRHYREWKKEVA